MRKKCSYSALDCMGDEIDDIAQSTGLFSLIHWHCLIANESHRLQHVPGNIGSSWKCSTIFSLSLDMLTDGKELTLMQSRALPIPTNSVSLFGMSMMFYRPAGCARE